MSSSRNVLNQKTIKQLASSTKQTTSSLSDRKTNLILSDLCINSLSVTQRKSLTTMADTEIGYSKLTNVQSKGYSICTADNLELKDRYDAYGNLIFKGSKSHKVTFIDNICRKNIAEVILVESENSIRNNTNDKEQTICQCETGCLIY